MNEQYTAPAASARLIIARGSAMSCAGRVIIMEAAP